LAGKGAGAVAVAAEVVECVCVAHFSLWAECGFELRALAMVEKRVLILEDRCWLGLGSERLGEEC